MGWGRGIAQSLRTHAKFRDALGPILTQNGRNIRHEDSFLTVTQPLSEGSVVSQIEFLDSA